MPLQLREAQLDDIHAMRGVYYSAFGDTIIGGHVFMKNIEASDRFWVASFKDELVDSSCQLLVVTNKNTPDSAEEIIAFAKWCLPGASIDDPPPVEAWPSHGELAVDFFGAMTKGHRKYMGDRPHWYLECIGTHKDWMGKGAATLLMRWGLERADADKLPCFLEATPKGKPIYERFGFRTLGEEVFEWPQGTTVEAYMERDAKTDTVTNGEQRGD
ncbi:N-acetyltransferase domain-containing protein [Fusarium sp. LHS14.1]|nr:N-acetyltransferase domain-containing protein [Fusarium sp. LHS14.1]